MTVTINGSGSLAGLSAGDLPDASVQQTDLAPNVAGSGPCFSVYLSASQAITTATSSRVLLNTELYDTNNAFDAVVNSRFQPSVAGYYWISGTVSVLLSTAGVSAYCSVWRNGAVFKDGTTIPQQATQLSISSVDALVYLNGSTDYVELYVYHNNGSTRDASGGSSLTYFQGFLARAA